jgi:acyl carrier protein
MTAEEVLEAFQELFRDVLDDPDLVLNRQSTAGDVEQWDSLSHISLIVAIEKQFEVKFTLDELQELKTVGDLADAVAAKAK